jgi:hypothetical protein
VKVVSGTSATVHLEKKKRKLGPKAGGPPKRSCAEVLLFGSPPMKARDYEDVTEVERSPLAALLVTSVLLASVEPQASASGSGGLLGVDVSDQEAESDEDGGRHVDIEGSPVEGAESCDIVPSPCRVSSGSHGSSSSSLSSGDSGRASFAKDDDQVKVVPAPAKASHSSSSSSESKNYFIS